MNQPAQRLCIFCRQLENGSSECPTLQRLGDTPVGSHLTLLQPEMVAPLPPTDEVLLSHLQNRPSQLCKRCADYDIARVFRSAKPLDLVQQAQLFGTDNPQREAYQRRITQHEIHTRQLSSFVLDASCPLCRLVYRILPRKNLDPRDNMVKLTPYRSHLRVPAWERLPAEMKAENAILIGVSFPDFAVPTVTPLTAGADYLGPESMTGEAICIAPECAFPGRGKDNFRFITPMVDFSLPRAALESCARYCGGVCQADQPPELLTTMMIDVEERATVQCPPNCDYFALSYVWGGVMPVQGALQSGTLPRTIEDAIVVTKKLGRRYLWVDALCIDQTPNPTPAQAALKAKQLQMMDLIYGCASLTIVAMSGSNSNAGLAGVSPSNPRTMQLKETIDGLTFFTVPPTPTAEKEVSEWDARAWTLQEGLLSRRKLVFTQTQMYFQCEQQSIMECFDTSTEMEWPNAQLDKADGLVRLRGGGVSKPNSNPSIPTDWFLHGFLGLLSGYTSRRMTNASDSLNALLGILSAWEKHLLPPNCGFVWGLPLKISPQFIGWMHDKKVGLSPKRRPDFPSWSWVGWEGEASIDTLLPEGVYSPEKRRRIGDMTVRFVAVEGKMLTVEGWVVKLNVRTEPFSEVVVGEGEGEKVIGGIMERNFLHNNTLKTGVYECLVVERVRGEMLGPGRERVRLFMVVLHRPESGRLHDGGDGVVERKTMITLTLFAGGDFDSTRPVRKMVTLV